MIFGCREEENNMGSKYTDRFKDNVIATMERDGLSGREAASLFNVAPSIIYSWLWARNLIGKNKKDDLKRKKIIKDFDDYPADKISNRVKRLKIPYQYISQYLIVLGKDVSGSREKIRDDRIARDIREHPFSSVKERSVRLGICSTILYERIKSLGGKYMLVLPEKESK